MSYRTDKRPFPDYFDENEYSFDDQRFMLVNDVDLAERIQIQYEAAIGRTSDYVGFVADHILSHNGIVFRPYQMDSYLVGQFIGDVFVVSHFAPETLRDGNRLMLEALHTSTPMMFAVPDPQARQAEKLGFRMVGKVPQWFAGEVILKTVMANDAVTDQHIAALMATYFDNA